MDSRMIYDIMHDIGLVPEFDLMINTLLFFIIMMGFLVIVVFSKKYSYLKDSIDRFF